MGGEAGAGDGWEDLRDDSQGQGCASQLPCHPSSLWELSFPDPGLSSTNRCGHRGKAQAPGLRAGQTCGVSHLWSPLQGWQRWIFRKPTLLPHFLSLFTKKPATIRKISQAASMASVSAASQGLPCGQDACLQPFVLLRSPGPLSLADAVCTGCSVTELIGGKRRRGKAR